MEFYIVEDVPISTTLLRSALIKDQANCVAQTKLAGKKKAKSQTLKQKLCEKSMLQLLKIKIFNIVNKLQLTK